ncbi:unnamed protein product [Linum tenue]|uniref:Glycosyltransferase n=1 Tax=Linum tenue TaxID=586396 RepID=A0AAV0KJC3_9ROSI|nr:unnamed protein product [Linum tenue]
MKSSSTQPPPPPQQQKPHAVLLPFPAQGHVNPFMQLAKLLHASGFHVTFVNTEHIHRWLVRTRGPESVKGLPDFQFRAFPDGLPPSDKDATQDPHDICHATQHYCLQPFMELMNQLNSTPEDQEAVMNPPVTCIVSDGGMTFSTKAAELLGVQHATFWPASACAFLAYLQFDELIRRGISPLQEANLTDGTLEKPLEWIPGMNNIRLRDMPSYATTMADAAGDIILFHTIKNAVRNSLKSSGLIINTFDALEGPVLAAILYSIGPLHLLGEQIGSGSDESRSRIGSSLWKEDLKCVEWIDRREADSVVYVNYGSFTTISAEQLMEFAWGLAESKRPFLWILRDDVVMGDSAVLPVEFLEEIKDRGCIANWCPQPQVLSHPAVAVFLTHCGWNSTMESVSAGVPMICWPFFGDQPTNRRYACSEWGIGVELSVDVKRGEIVDLVERVMSTEEGQGMKQRALEWKRRAREAIDAGGSSINSFTRFVEDHATGVDHGANA